ncbi:MAG: DUF4386 domain-containing protein [Candidatus Eremiobacteraeota bacterium]|nr:DUF4386 domain-containing protein [Candidatus Eremiobacteraeota bacterium]
MRMANVKARLAGVFYLITTVTGIFAEFFVRGTFVVPADAAATALHIQSGETLYRLGFVADLIGGGAYIVVSLLLYELLRPVNTTMALLALIFSLIGSAIGGVVGLAHLAPLFLLGNAHYLTAFDTAQLQALALLSLKLHTQGYLISLMFFGVFEVLVGYLMFRSTFFPRILGALVAVAGMAFVANSLIIFVWPALGRAVSDYFVYLDGIGEIALMLWLLFAGVNTRKWEAIAAGTVHD